MQVSEVISDVKHHLYGSFRTERNRLNQDMTDSTEQMSLDFTAQGAARGAYVEVDDEMFYSWGPASSNAQLINVTRGEFGTTPAAHSSGATVEVNPRFPTVRIMNTMKDEIRSWPQDIYQVELLTLSVKDNRWVVLDGVDNLLRPLLVSYRDPDGIVHEVRSWRETRSIPSADGYAYGIQLFSVRHEITSVQCLVAKSFNLSTFARTTDLISDVGVPSTMLDVVSIGTIWRMMSTREIARTFIESQGDSRRGEEVPPTHITQTVRSLERQRDARLREEMERLIAQYGWRVR